MKICQDLVTIKSRNMMYDQSRITQMSLNFNINLL